MLSGRPERSLPERTVDAWVAAAVCSAFPGARIWDPTQVIRGRNWDRAVHLLGAGKIFILEDKATTAVARKRTTPLNTHRIDIGRVQFDWYCDEIEPDGGIPVYYVLPDPPWKGSTDPVSVPEQAACRVTSTAGPFTQWAHVVRCTALRAALEGRRSVETHELPLLPGAMPLADFFTSVRWGQEGRWLPEPDELDFVTGLGGRDPHRPGDRRDRHEGSALAVFAPAADFASQQPEP